MRTLPKLPRPLSPAERPFARPTWPDAYIEHWALVYLLPDLNRRLRALQVRFETFLYAPAEITAALVRQRLISPRTGLLAAQRLVQERLDQEEQIWRLSERVGAAAAEFHCANGRVVEKLRHHAHPRSRAIFHGRP